MFGISFGKASPQPGTRTERHLDNGETFQILRDFGFIKEQTTLSSEDYEVINKRSSVIQAHHPVSHEVAVSLAFVDRMILKEKGNQSAEADLVSLIDHTFVEMLTLHESLSHDKEFADSVVRIAAARYHEGKYTIYSDALFASLAERETAIANSGVSGKIDGTGNVVLKSDEQPFEKLS